MLYMHGNARARWMEQSEVRPSSYSTLYLYRTYNYYEIQIIGSFRIIRKTAIVGSRSSFYLEETFRSTSSMTVQNILNAEKFMENVRSCVFFVQGGLQMDRECASQARQQERGVRSIDRQI